jgi:hypothetical protein
MEETIVDPEVMAVMKLTEALGGLDEPARRRVLQWAMERFGTQQRPPTASRAVSGTGAPPALYEVVGGNQPEQEDFPALFNRAGPTTAVDRALVASYYLHSARGATDFGSQEANALLKDLGHGIENITLAFNGMMAQSPKLAMQVQKSGTSKQARKRYRLTQEGIARVKRMLDRGMEATQ